MGVLLDLLFPSRCAFCGRIAAGGVCGECAGSLPFAAQPLREIGDLPCVAPLCYEGKARETLLRLKFHGGRDAAEGCARLLCEAVDRAYGDGFEHLSFVPLSSQRQRERGYNQSELIARHAAKRWSRRLEPLLRRTRHTAAQSGLASAALRWSNTRGAFAAFSSARLDGDRVLLIDDILTTGATLTACAEALREMGARRVLCACVAMTDSEKTGGCE